MGNAKVQRWRDEPSQHVKRLQMLLQGGDDSRLACYQVYDALDHTRVRSTSPVRPAA